jgi:hypothetical protein
MPKTPALVMFAVRRLARVSPTCWWLCLALLASPVVQAAELPGILFHAEHFVGNAKVVEDPTALGGKAVRGTRWYYFCQDVPFPQGGGKYHVYLRVKSEGTDNPVQLTVVREGKLKVVASVASPPAGRWTWVEFAPLDAKTVGPRFAVHGGGQAAAQWTLLDGLVIARRSGISSQTLDDAFQALPSQAGLLVAPRTDVPPIVDGVVDDACYRSAPPAFPFVRLGQPRFAQSQTRVWAACDDAKLYLAARLLEPALDVAANRRGDFRPTIAEHDGPVWKDECLEVFLDASGQGRECYRIAVNALGTIYDARAQDSRFESGAVAKARVGDGFWSVELSVPLKSLGIEPSANGRILGVNFARHRHLEPEVSCWSPASRLDAPREFSRLALLGVGPSEPAGLGLQTWELFRFGENRLGFTGVGRGDVTAYAQARVERDKPVSGMAWGATGPGRSPLEVKYALAESGRSTLQFLLVDNSTGLPAHRSPLYPGEVAGTVAEITLHSDGPIELFSNGERVAGTAGKDLSAKVPLVDGLNALAVKTAGATLSGHIRSGDFDVPVDTGWRWTPGPGVVSPSLDLNNATKVTRDGTGIRAPGAGGVFRKSIAVNATRSWPNYGPAMYLAHGSAQWFHLKLKGIRGLAMLKKPVVVVDVPEGLDLIDGAGFYGRKRKEQPRFAREDRGPITERGVAFRRVAFRSDLPIRTKELVNVLSLFSVTVRPAAGGPLRPGSETRLFYHLEDADGAIVEIPRALPMRIVEPLAGQQPKGIVLQCWPGWLSTYDGTAGRDALLDTIARAGFNDVGHIEEAAAAMRQRGLRTNTLIDFQPWVLNLAPYIKAHPGEALVDAKGKRSEKSICTTRLVGHAWDDFVDRAIAGWLERVGPDSAVWDYESSAFTGYLACYDDCCLAAFRQWARLPGDAPLTPDRIQRDYHQAWLDFMAQRSSEVARRFRESIKKHRPATAFSMYSGYQCEETKEIYNVDWSLCTPHLDLVTCGYGRRLEEVAATRKAAGRTPCVFGSITYPYEFNDDRVASAITAAEVLRRLCDARGGVLYYDLNNGDARTLAAFAKVSRVAAQFTEFFAHGAEDRSGFKVASGNAGDVYVFALGPRKLLSLVNESAKPARFEIDCPSPAADFLAKTTVAGTRLRVDVPAGDIGVFTFTSAHPR